jgi:hypothetical protein
MSRLALFGRPYTIFDPTNKDHRRWFAEFNKSLTWAHCPVRFVVDDDHGDLVTMIQRHLIQYYVDKEFGTDKEPKGRPKSVVEKQQTKVSQKRQKKVDN